MFCMVFMYGWVVFLVKKYINEVKIVFFVVVNFNIYYDY